MSNKTLSEQLTTVAITEVSEPRLGSNENLVQKLFAKTFNVLDAFSAQELEALTTLVSVRMKPAEIEALETEFPLANGAELFIIYKMRALAKDEIIASEWRRFGGDWKNSATSYARQFAASDEAVVKYAQKAAAELALVIPRDYHEA